MADVTTDDGGPTPATLTRYWLVWMTLSLVAVAALALFAVHLPPVVKKLGLFAIAFGLAAGWLTAEIRRRLVLPPAHGSLASAFVLGLILAGQIGMALESWRLRRIEFDQTSEARNLRFIADQPLPFDPKSLDFKAELTKRLEERRSFAGYLRYRVAPLGSRIASFAPAVWAFEMLLGGIAGTMIFRRSSRLDGATPAAKLET